MIQWQLCDKHIGINTYMHMSNYPHLIYGISESSKLNSSGNYDNDEF